MILVEHKPSSVVYIDILWENKTFYYWSNQEVNRFCYRYNIDSRGKTKHCDDKTLGFVFQDWLAAGPRLDCLLWLPQQ